MTNKFQTWKVGQVRCYVSKLPDCAPEARECTVSCVFASKMCCREDSRCVAIIIHNPEVGFCHFFLPGRYLSMGFFEPSSMVSLAIVLVLLQEAPSHWAQKPHRIDHFIDLGIDGLYRPGHEIGFKKLNLSTWV